MNNKYSICLCVSSTEVFSVRNMTSKGEEGKNRFTFLQHKLGLGEDNSDTIR
jgi:hypothetical protein